MGAKVWLRHHKDNQLCAEVVFVDTPRNAYLSGAIDLRVDDFARIDGADREHTTLENAQGFADSMLSDQHICNDGCGDWYVPR